MKNPVSLYWEPKAYPGYNKSLEYSLRIRDI